MGLSHTRHHFYMKQVRRLYDLTPSEWDCLVAVFEGCMVTHADLSKIFEVGNDSIRRRYTYPLLKKGYITKYKQWYVVTGDIRMDLKKKLAFVEYRSLS